VVGERVAGEKIGGRHRLAKELLLLLLRLFLRGIGLFVAMATRAVESKQFRSSGKLSLVLRQAIDCGLGIGWITSAGRVLEVRGTVRRQVRCQAAVPSPGFLPILAEVLVPIFR